VATPVSYRSSQIQSLAAAMASREQSALTLLSERHFTVRECADACRIHISTFRAWLRAGLVKYNRTGRLGKIRIPESELQRLLGKGQVQP
jgi:excisionase family DNA binding protein